MNFCFRRKKKKRKEFISLRIFWWIADHKSPHNNRETTSCPANDKRLSHLCLWDSFISELGWIVWWMKAPKQDWDSIWTAMTKKFKEINSYCAVFLLLLSFPRLLSFEWGTSRTSTIWHWNLIHLPSAAVCCTCFCTSQHTLHTTQSAVRMHLFVTFVFCWAIFSRPNDVEKCRIFFMGNRNRGTKDCCYVIPCATRFFIQMYISDRIKMKVNTRPFSVICACACACVLSCTRQHTHICRHNLFLKQL